MEKEPILTGTFLSGKEKYGSHKSSDTVSLELVIAKIKFKRTVRRLIKMIKG